MEQIAESAELHVQTLYRHFPSKQLLAASVERMQFEAALAESNEDTLTTWRAWVDSAARGQLELDGGVSFIRYVHELQSNPKVAVAVMEIGREYTELLTTGLANDFGMDPERDNLPGLVASMLWSGNGNAVGRWYRAGGEADLVNLTVGVVDEVRDIVSRLMPY